MRRILSVAAAVAMAASFVMPVSAQQAAPKKEAAPKAAAQSKAAPKAGPGEKVCRHKFPDGTPNAWVCKSAEPCCAWDEIKYVKCGSTVFACL
jgi:hypothetical protein